MNSELFFALRNGLSELNPQVKKELDYTLTLNEHDNISLSVREKAKHGKSLFWVIVNENNHQYCSINAFADLDYGSFVILEEESEQKFKAMFDNSKGFICKNCGHEHGLHRLMESSLEIFGVIKRELEKHV